MDSKHRASNDQSIIKPAARIYVNEKPELVRESGTLGVHCQ